MDELEFLKKLKSELYTAELGEGTKFNLSSMYKKVVDRIKKLEEEESLLVKQLDEWIDSCKEQAKAFKQRDMTVSEISSEAMGVAYTNVKKLITKEHD